MLNKAIKIENGDKLELFRSVIETFTEIEPLFGYVRDEYIDSDADSGYMVFDEDVNGFFLTKTILDEKIIDLDEFIYWCFKEKFYEDMNRRQNFLSVDKACAINSWSELFTIGEIVGHEDEEAGLAKIISFEAIEEENEITVHTTKGAAHLDFLRKPNAEELEDEVS